MAGAEEGAAPVTAARPAMPEVGGRQVLLGLQNALAYLQANQETVNDLNVFPVPDGDTGSNMYLTLRSAAEDASRAAEPHSAASVLDAAAHGSLMGARGNSGVILSQILRGFSIGVEGRARIDARQIAAAFDQAREVAYKAVMKPTEGTILTVVREAAAAARRSAEDPSVDVSAVLEAAAVEAHASVERTPEMLAVLRDAGVVDAGGLGLAIILEGFWRAMQSGDGEGAQDSVPPRVGKPVVRRPGGAQPPGRGGAAAAERRGAASVAEQEGGWGYCTEFVVLGSGLDLEAMREELGALGESSLVVGDAELVRVHIHTHDPARLIAAAALRGELSRLKVEDMSAQHHDVLRRASDAEAAPQPDAGAAGAPAGEGAAAGEAGRLRAQGDAAWGNGAVAGRRALGVVSVAPGPGFREILLSIGADHVVEGGQTMNPSTEELLRAVREANADAVIILPNNKNVILTAEQVDSLVDDGTVVRVVPSRTLPQGISALLTLDPAGTVDENCARMAESLGGVTTVEVTRAVRDSVANGKEIKTGDVIAIVDGEITQVGDDTGEVVERVVASASRPPELITVYRGAGVSDGEARSLVDSLSGRHPDAEVELHEGGQDHYPFILSLE